jgi:ATP-dependent DNA helicase RecG
MSLEPAAPDLNELLRSENARVEWKRGVADPQDVARTLTAFANDYANLGGGYVVCGVDEVRDAHGFPATKRVGLDAARLREIKKRVLAALRDRAEPKLAPSAYEQPADTDDRRILVFEMPASSTVHSFRHDRHGTGCPIRIDADTIDARNGLYLELRTRKGALPPWDRRAAPGATVADLDLVLLRDTLQRIGVWDRQPDVDAWLHPDQPLSGTAPALVVRDGAVVRPANFAILLFGREPSRFCPGAVTRFSAYPGTERDADTAELHDLSGPLPKQIRQVFDLLETQSATLVDKRGGPANVERYPLRALQEAVVNAFAHRDYALDDPTRVTVFADRIEIRSPGGLLPSIDPASLASGTAPPRWRNQALAWLFLKLGLAQQEGQGLRTILSQAKRIGAPTPRFEVGPADVACVLYAHRRSRVQADLAAVERSLAADRLEDAWARIEGLAAEQPDHPEVQSVRVEVAARMGRLPDVLDALGQRAFDFGRLNAPARATLVEDAVDRFGDAPWPEYAEAALEGLLGEALNETLEARLATALGQTSRLEAMQAFADRYSAREERSGSDDEPLRNAVKMAWMREVRRAWAVAADEAQPKARRRRAVERFDFAVAGARAALDKASGGLLMLLSDKRRAEEHYALRQELDDLVESRKRLGWR